MRVRRVYFFISTLILLSLFCTAFLWLAAHSSGHKILFKTNLYFGVAAVSLLVVYFLLRKAVRKK